MIERILITGATGLLGPWLVEACTSRGEVVTTSRSGGDVPADLTSETELHRLLEAVRPSAVIHAAAMTDVDACERDPELADRTNRLAVQRLAEALDDSAGLVVVSTDQVYPDVPGPHEEGSEAPVNVYARSKAAGERAGLVRPGTAVLRTNFFGPSRSPGRESLSDFMIRKLRSAEPVTLFADVQFSPLHLGTVAAACAQFAVARTAGVFNLGSRDGLSKHDFGMLVARHLNLSTASARPGRSDCVPARAPRPHDLRLAVRRIEEETGTVMPTVESEIKKL